MPPVLKKILALIVMIVLVNIGFVWYGQASFDTTFQSLAKAFSENNETCGKHSSLPSPVEHYLERSNVSSNSYRTILLQLDGIYKKRPGSKPIEMHALALLRPTPDMLWAVRLNANPLVTFNALETYHGGHAVMQMSLFGIVPTGEFDSERFARSELARVLAYALFNPLLLSCDAVTYKTNVEGQTVTTIHDGETDASVTFLTNDEGEIVELFSDDRARPAKDGLQPARWRMKILSYGNLDGLRLPKEIEESWIVDGAPFIYASYTVTSAKRL